MNLFQRCSLLLLQHRYQKSHINLNIEYVLHEKIYYLFVGISLLSESSIPLQSLYIYREIELKTKVDNIIV